MDLTKSAQISRHLVTKMEAGYVPLPNVLDRIACVLGCAASGLWPEGGER